MSSSLWEPNPPKPPHPPLPPAPPPSFLASSLQRKTMVSKENLSDMAQQDTPVHVQYQPSGAMWHTYDSTSPPLNSHLAAVFKGNKWSTIRSAEFAAALCVATTIIGPHQTTSAHDRCRPEAPWPSSWHALTQTQSTVWAVGAATQCYVTSTRQHKRSQRGSRRAWSNTGTTHLSYPPTGT